MSGAELSALIDRVKALEAAVDDLSGAHPISGETVAATHRSEPEIRVRISHAHTLKDGWRCDSTTVEWTGAGDPDWDAIRDHLAQAHVIGAGEAGVRNNGVAPLPEAAS